MKETKYDHDIWLKNLWTKRGNKKYFKNVNNKMWVKNVGVKETELKNMSIKNVSKNMLQ